MKIKGAMTVLNKRDKFYGMTFEELIKWLDKKVADKTTVGYVDETIKVLQAYEVYKMDQGFCWCGINGVGWTTLKGKIEEYNVAYNGGHQLELNI